MQQAKCCLIDCISCIVEGLKPESFEDWTLCGVDTWKVFVSFDVDE